MARQDKNRVKLDFNIGAMDVLTASKSRPSGEWRADEWEGSTHPSKVCGLAFNCATRELLLLLMLHLSALGALRPDRHESS